MKTETQISEENIKIFKNPFPDGIEGNPWTAKIREGVKGNVKESMVSHKASCERDVPKLKKIKESIVYVENELTHHLLDELIEDKKQAIKLYEDNGIKNEKD